GSKLRRLMLTSFQIFSNCRSRYFPFIKCAKYEFTAIFCQTPLDFFVFQKFKYPARKLDRIAGRYEKSRFPILYCLRDPIDPCSYGWNPEGHRFEHRNGQTFDE